MTEEQFALGMKQLQEYLEHNAREILKCLAAPIDGRPRAITIHNMTDAMTIMCAAVHVITKKSLTQGACFGAYLEASESQRKPGSEPSKN